MTKKVFGYLFIAISILLFLTAMGQFPMIFANIIAIFDSLAGKLDGNQTSRILGTLSYWIVHIGLMVFLWKKGRKWSRSAGKDYDQRLPK
jgi:hypothetical protein